jgi:hypothetical protein
MVVGEPHGVQWPDGVVLVPHDPGALGVEAEHQPTIVDGDDRAIVY